MKTKKLVSVFNIVLNTVILGLYFAAGYNVWRGDTQGAILDLVLITTLLLMERRR